ncbi:MAG: autotransporter domain-containing protein [Alphaproteobacteria bacterium]|nr:autotransporter domain-containing protein [Alphaproteobacteria bacterium]
MSADGSVIAGQSTNSNGVDDWAEAFRWTLGGGMQGLGVLSGRTHGGRNSTAYLMSADGSVIVGLSSNSNGVDDWEEAFHWTSGGGMQGLGVLADGIRFSYPFVMSTDGSVIGGYSVNSNGVNDWLEAFRWTSGAGMQGLGLLGVWVLGQFDGSYGGDRLSFPYLMSADGSVIGGYSSNSNGVNDWLEAFRWTSGGGMQGLGVLGMLGPSGSIAFSIPDVMSADGSVIAGQSSNFDGVDVRHEAFRWTSGGGMKSVADWIGSSVDLTGIRLFDASYMSADGTVIAGRMTDDGGGTYTPYWARVGGLLEPEVLAASLGAMLPVAPAASAMGAGALDTLGEIAAHHRCGNRESEALCFFAAGSNGNHADSMGNQDVPAGTFGLSASIAPGWRLGAGALINRTTIDELAFSSQHDIDGDGIGAYVSFEEPQGGLSVEVSVIALLLDADIDRAYLNGAAIEVSESQGSGSNLGAKARAGWAMPVDEQLSLMPFASASIVATILDRFGETGGAFPASFDEQRQTSVQTQLGSEVTAKLLDDVSFWASAAWAHRFEDRAAGISGEVAGIGPFAIEGAALQTNWAEGQWGLEFSPFEGAHLSASVTGRTASPGDMPVVEGRIALSVKR